ncbi:hypothetical protein [Streptomyces xanthochromogenes]|uniref:hypothetical protein n=1 Tax=Streptomyces xanthochromogenes TaxID=67384 RepID=UPI001E625057|nr:hypothetical protein [Streptomyces xanthochromogenes]
MMFFAAIGSIFLIAGLLLATNIARAAERAYQMYALLTPRAGTATPTTLRIVGAFWIPLGAFFLTVGILR